MLTQHTNNPHLAANVRVLFSAPYTLDDANRFNVMAAGSSSNILFAIEVDGIAVGGVGIHPLEEEYK